MIKNTPPIKILKKKNLKMDELPAERIAIGQPGDYKPCVAKLPDGKLLIIGFQSRTIVPGTYIEPAILFRSEDDGRSWSQSEPISHIAREPYFTALDDGTLLVTTHLLSIDVRNIEGKVDCQICHSEDEGKTWHIRYFNSILGNRHAYTVTSRNVLVKNDGALMLLVSGSPAEENFIFRSFDNGKTWSEPILCKVENLPEDYGQPFFGETFLWQAKSGKIYALARVTTNEFPVEGQDDLDSYKNDQYEHLVIFTSVDDGLTWQQGKNLGPAGIMYPAIIRLQDGRLLLTFTVRTLDYPLGVRAVIGTETEDGFEFDMYHDHIMLDGKTPKAPTFSSGGGFGPTVQLEDGTLVTAYSYRHAEGDSGVRMEVVSWNLPQ